MEKKQLRQKGKQILSEMTSSKREKVSKQIAEHFRKTSWWQQANVMGATIAQRHEIDTTYIIEFAWNSGKTVVVPKCFPKQDHSMAFYQITDFNQLEKVYAGLLEPIPSESTLYEKKEIDLLLVPGLLFDQKGYRIGHGGGYYDRYLKGFNHTTVSIATKQQITSEVPHNEYDIPVQHIITEDGVLY
ncbi:5-formyltetrahydrofolate cyclo-ligase [Salinibacillus xinjiangensis]|uniref:5-formyltetrahydrofolate cyclo-ligase n=1 Tax=Salinibacillus xinjiangensis TaxID=1229268 RepID=A0A6G1X6M8_9BACI|nr:5-formyltetrahydrofolate cyclo-ligase [Salinibacillus xinjiangensis]MRG86592.1 5-formyltetrahydrofolate cyclo-ligase [Salinibacillus xinjiangensis]